ncbi:MAG: YybH family protein, partial [Acidobacteriota bacterium]
CAAPAPPAVAPEAAQVEADIAAINEIWNQYSSSLKSGDAERWISLWTDDGVQMPPDEPPVIGREQIGAGTKGFLDEFVVESFDITTAEVRVAGDWAFARGTFKGAYVPKEGGEAFFDDGKFMTILQRQADGSWKIHRDIFNSNVPPD